MLCDNCKVNQANVFLKQTVNNENITINLCEFCADKINFDLYFTNFFKDFLDEVEKINFFTKIDNNLNIKKCTTCGNTLENFKNTAKLGCGDCYTIFKENLNDIINKIQHNNQHIGKLPKNLNPQIKLKIEIKDLKNKLQNAIKQENYELAIKIRDEIRKIEKNIQKEA